MRPDRKAADLVRSHVNAWDPIGLVSLGCPDDEYDCIATPLIGLLARGASDEEVLAWLDRMIPDHFGEPCPTGAATFLVQIREAWATMRSNTPDVRGE